MTEAQDKPTGADLVAEIRAAVAAQRVPLKAFLAPLTPDPPRFMHQLAAAKRPKAHTIARIRAAIAGAPIPPLPDLPARVVRCAPEPPQRGAEFRSLGGADLAARIERDQAERRAKRQRWLEIEQHRYGLQRRGRLVEDMPA